MKSSKSVLAIAAVGFTLMGFTLVGCKGGPTGPYGGGSTGSTGSGNTPFESGTVNTPAEFVHVFPSAGTVGYHCRFHASMGMTGTVTVASGAADSALVTASGTSFVPATVSIKPGGYVHWRVTEGTHTVTSN